MKNNKKIVLIIQIIENILLGFAKYIVIFGSMLAAYLDDYLIRTSDIEKTLTVAMGLLIAIILDLIINFIICKLINRKNNCASYKQMISISLVVTIVIFIYLKIVAI